MLKALDVSFLLACTTFVPYIHFLCLLLLPFFCHTFFISITSFRFLLSIYSFLLYPFTFLISIFLFSFFPSILFFLSFILIFSYFSPYYSFFLPYFFPPSHLYNKRTCYTQSPYEECCLKVCAKRNMTVNSVCLTCTFPLLVIPTTF